MDKCSLNIYLKSPLCSIEEEQIIIIIQVWTIMSFLGELLLLCSSTPLTWVKYRQKKKKKLVQDLTLSNGQISVSLYVEQTQVLPPASILSAQHSAEDETWKQVRLWQRHTPHKSTHLTALYHNPPWHVLRTQPQKPLLLTTVSLTRSAPKRFHWGQRSSALWYNICLDRKFKLQTGEIRAD